MFAVKPVPAWAALGVAALLSISCAGRAPPREAPPVAAESGCPAASGEPAAAAVDACLPPETPPVEESAGAAESASYRVSEEVYSRTFEEVESFIRGMDEIIQGHDFVTWQEHLTLAYRDRISNPGFLEEQSRQPLLRQNGIRLNCLEDYFEQVVIPSRSGAHLDDIEFINEDHVKAISVIRGTRGVLYLLVREGGRWKIGIW